MSLLSCPGCAARLPPGATWCSLCYTDLPTAPAQRLAVGAEVAGSRPAAAGGTPTVVVPGAECWPCTRCGGAAPLAAPSCPSCGAAFLAGLSGTAGSDGGAVDRFVALPPATRLAVAAGLGLLLCVGLLVVLTVLGLLA